MQKDKILVRSPNFQVGDYVHVSKHRKSGTSNQVASEMEGPCRVASKEFGHVFAVDNLLPKEL
jgi:hypothetical protein